LYYQFKPTVWKPENHRLMVYNNQYLFNWHVNRNIVRNEKLTTAQKEPVGYFTFHNDKWVLVNQKMQSLKDLTADKEIPVIKFPSALMDGPTTPLRLEASLKAGVYFNVAIPLPPTNGIPAPSAGAFVEFYGKLSVMCVSLAAATVYAIGQATVRISADTVTGPALYMKFGFGVELMVGLPVIGNVSVTYAVGVEMSLDTQQITIGAFLLFRGRAELIGGLVTVTIQIEAAGKVQDRFGDETNMIAQVTFSLDISICFVIDINFTESWQEQRQIA